jgi:ribulose-5-phosphate 4-epimerase/fuculose-1-phosphate aldolase
MRNHGVLVTGTSPEEATVDALILEKAARFQTIAFQAGIEIGSAGEETLNKREQLLSRRNFKSPWNYCVRKLRR